MSRRIDIELTSTRPDGSWTWRAAGAKQPKGDVDGAMLPAGTKVGDTLRVDTESYLEGVVVVAVLPSARSRQEQPRIEVVGTKRNEELVTSTLVEKRGRRDGDRGDRGPRTDRPDGDRRPRGDRPARPAGDRPARPAGDRPARPAGDRPARPAGDRPARPAGDRPRGDRPAGDRPRGDRPAGDRPPRTEHRGPRPEGAVRPPRRDRPIPPPAPTVVRLRPGRAHRNAVLAELPEAQRPIADQLLRGGVPGVRQAIDKQNEAARAVGEPELKADSLLAFAEQLLPRLRAAEWHDKADAALAGIDEIDLRDLRTVVGAADTAARDEQTRAVAQQLRDGLAARVDGEHGKWLSELNGLVAEGRTVRALRLSSHPPKAGAPLPSELAERLAALASAGLAPEITQDRWATLVDAAAFSPVRLVVKPVGVPAVIADELKATIARVGARVPQIAELFGITPEAAPARRGPAARARRPGQITGGPARPIPPAPPRQPVPDASVVPVVLVPVVDDAPADIAPVVEATDLGAVVEHTGSSNVEPDVVMPSGEAAHEAMAAEELRESAGEV